MRWPNVQSQKRTAPTRPSNRGPYSTARAPHSRLLLLPNEILLEIAESLPTRTLFNLHLCCHRLHTLLQHRLIAAIPRHAQHVMTWSIDRCSPTHFTHALAAGAYFTSRDIARVITLNHAALLPALFAARPGCRRAIAPPSPPPPARRQHIPPLHHAVRRGAYECVAALLREGACPDLLDREGNRPLWYALHGRRGEEARALVAAGAGRVLGCGGADALRYALQERPEMVGVMTEAGWALDGVLKRDGPGHGGVGGVGGCCRPLDGVVQVERVGETETIVQTEVGVALDATGELRGVGERSLQIAVRDGRLDVVRGLLAAGADVNELGDGRKTVRWAPLHESVSKKGREQIMKLLLENGARVDILGQMSMGTTLRARAWKGLTPLQLAKSLKNRQAVAMLKAYGARE